MKTEITSKEVFKAQQVLTLEVAKTLVGKTIAVTNWEYSGNSEHVRVGKVLSIETQWDLAGKRDHSQFDGGKWATRQDYWMEKLPTTQHESAKNTLSIVSDTQLFATCDLLDKWTYEVPTFFGSDSDRPIYYVIIEDEN